ncbi:MAG: tetratricopeptide repeat protein [Candidatus Baltobacteraceae bacterium]
MSISPARGLPPRIYVPIAALIAIIFLSVMAYFLRIGFGVSGAVLGEATGSQPPGRAGSAQPNHNVQVGGGPPPAVAAQLQQLRAQIAARPNDDVALVQLADLYLAVQKYAQAIPLYNRALVVNPKNVAAKAGLDEATTGLAGEQQR